jgi:aspartyl-tRNA(Asn)/glutamyl-tRNA(Gln) amidotransferase subunit A
VVLTPFLPVPIPTIPATSGRTGEDDLDMVVSLTRDMKVVNYSGRPSISVPCGFTSNGLPTAFQLIGRPLHEASLLHAVDRFQQATDWHARDLAWLSMPAPNS